MIEIDRLKFSYQREPTLKDISLNIAEGEWLGILGPNGSGKTTLIKVLCGILNKESGSIKIQGRLVEEITKPKLARLMAVVPQDSKFTFPFSALEVVLMGRAPYIKYFGFETSRDLDVARKVMELTDTWQFRNRSIHKLSGGECQRVVIARALAQEPNILLLDEPTTFLDLKHQSDIIKLLTDLNREKKLTIISVLHDANLATLCSTRIAFLKEGKVFTVGRPEEVLTYANIKNVFNTDVYVGLNDFTGRPYYIPIWEGMKE